MPLSTAPDGEVAVGAPVGRGGLGLDVALMYRFSAVFPLHDYICLFEPLLRVTYLEDEAAGDVAGLSGVAVVPVAAWTHIGVDKVGKPFVKDWGVFFHGIEDVHYGGEYLVLHLNGRQSFLGQMGAGGGHGRHRMSLVQHLVDCHAVIAHELGIIHGAFAEVRHPAGDLRQVCCGQHSSDSGHLPGLACVDG